MAETPTASTDEKVVAVLGRHPGYWVGIDVIVQETDITQCEAFHALDRLMHDGVVLQHPSCHPNYALVA